MFNSDHRHQDLARKSIRGGVHTLVAQFTQSILQFVRAIVLARLLTPTDFGLVGMVLVVINFAQLFRDAGISLATVQKKEITHDQVSTLFWIIVVISATLGILLFLMAPLVAAFYAQPELIFITAALSISLFIGGIGIQHQALMRRHMQFGSLAVIQVVSGMGSLIVTIVLACNGWRYWALVGGMWVRVSVMTLMTFSFCPWVPGKIRTGTGVRKMLKFGGHVTGANIINYLSVNIDNLLIGRFLGASALGLYAKAYQLFMLPITQIKSPLTQLAMPVLGSLQHQPERYRRYYQTILRTLAVLTMPVACYCVVEAEFIIGFLLGSGWLEAVSVFRILAVAGIVWPVVGTWGLVTLSLGYSKRYFQWALLNGFVMAVAIACGLPFGITGVALAIVIATYMKCFPCLYYCFSCTPITVPLFMRTTMAPFLASVVAAFCIVIVRHKSTLDTTGYHFLYAGLFAATFMMLLICHGSSRRDLKTLVHRFADLKSPSQYPLETVI